MSLRGLTWLLLLASGVAHAQALDAGVIELPPVDVPLPPEPTASSPARRDPSASITVIDARAHQGEVKDAAELLLETPGAVVQDSGGAGQRKTLSLRGASPNAVLVLLDGVPLTGPGKAMDLSRIPAAILERMEVVRGGASSRYGPGAMGGVVNLVTRAPEGSHVFGEVTQGSFLTTLGSVGGSTTVGPGDGLLLLHGLHSTGDFTFLRDSTPVFGGDALVPTRRENNAALQGGGMARYRTHVLGAALDFLGEGSAETRGLAGTVQNPTTDAAQTTARGTLSARLTSSLAGGELQVLGFGRLDDTALKGSPFGPGVYRQLESGAGAEAVYTRLVAERHGLTALVTGGGDWLREPSGKNPSWGRLGAMAADEVLFFDGRFSVNGSARVDVAGPFVVVSPKLGAAAQLPLGFEVHANAGQASRPPSFAELYLLQGSLMPNAELRPERALTADASLAWRHELAAVQVTGFGSFYEDLISYEYYPPALARPYNFQAASVAGLEAEASFRPARWLEASASYTYLTTQNLKDDPRYYLKSLPYRPAHRVQARVLAGVPLLSGHAEVLAQSAQFQNRTETLSLPARAFVNVGVSTTPWKNRGGVALTLAFEVKNLLDVQSQDLDGYPLPPRAAYLTLAVAWDAARKTP